MVLFHQAQSFRRQSQWDRKRSLLKDSCLCWHRDPLWLWHLPTFPSTSFHCPPLLPFHSPHIHSIYSLQKMLSWPSVLLTFSLICFSPLCAFVYFFPSSPLGGPSGEDFREHKSVVTSPRITLRFPSYCGHIVHNVMVYFLMFSLFVWFLYALTFFLPLPVTVYNAYHR